MEAFPVSSEDIRKSKPGREGKNAKSIQLKSSPTLYLEGLEKEKMEKKVGTPTTHLVTTTKDQYWTKIEPHVGNDRASQPQKKKF